MARLDGHYGRSTGTSRAVRSNRGGSEKRGIQTCLAAGDGRVEFVSRSAEAVVWEDRGISGAARARFDGPGADSRDRRQDRCVEDAVYRIQQIRVDARAEYLQTILFRALR